MHEEPAIVFCLIDRILSTCRESGATLEQSIAAVRAVEAILPVSAVRSEKDFTVHG